MKTFLQGFVGKKIDVVCAGGVAVRGEVEAIETDVLVLKDDEDKVCYVAVDKITVVWETRDKQPRTGFVSGFAGKS
jgi:hypothetical protein